MAKFEALWSSNSDEYATPQHVFDELNNEFNFNLDVAANENNHKCEAYFDLKSDGLSQDWGGYRVFCNPPYSQIGKWVKKAFYESKKDNTLVVMLIPSRTDTRYFHDYIYKRTEIRFIKGRLKFGGNVNSAPFPSMIVIFRGAKVEI